MNEETDHEERASFIPITGDVHSVEEMFKDLYSKLAGLPVDEWYPHLRDENHLSSVAGDTVNKVADKTKGGQII